MTINTDETEALTFTNRSNVMLCAYTIRAAENGKGDVF